MIFLWTLNLSRSILYFALNKETDPKKNQNSNIEYRNEREQFLSFFIWKKPCRRLSQSI